MPSEANIQKAIVEALIWDGWMILRINQGGRRDDWYDNITGKEIHIKLPGILPTKTRYVRFAYWQALGIDQQDSGISDVIAIKSRRTQTYNHQGRPIMIDISVNIAIEVKAPGKKANVTDKQQAFLDAIEEHGGIAIVADSLEDIEPYLDRAIAQ